MQTADYRRIIRRWLVPAIIIALVIGSAAYAVSKYAIRSSYTSKVVMEVQFGISTPGTTVDPAVSTQIAQTDAQLAEQYPNVNQAVNAAVRAMHKPISPKEADSVRHAVTCTADTLTALFTCSVTSHDPVFASTVANSLSRVFIRDEQKWDQLRYGGVLRRITSDEQRAQRAHNQTEYTNLVQLEAGVRQASAQQATILRVVAPANVPQSPSSPHVLLNSILAFFVGLMLVMAGGTLLDRLDDSIRGEEDLKTLSGLPLLSSIPRVPSLTRSSAAPGSLLVQLEPRSPVAEAFRLARTGIAFSHLDDPPRVLLVTSSLEGEGKSTVAANLAVAFAEEGKSVILVDLDLRRPSLSKMFVGTTVGLTNLLLDHHPDPQNYLDTSEVPNLRVLASGPVPPNPAELLSSRRLREVVAQLRTQSDLVILDSPPLLAVADAVIAGSLADTALLVVRIDRVHRKELRRAIETLQSRGIAITGMISNSLPKATGSYHYYSYGGRPRSRGSSDVEPQVTAQRAIGTAEGTKSVH